MTDIIYRGDLDRPLTSAELDANFRSIAENKVENATGKGLSTNDYTNEEKAKNLEVVAGSNVNLDTSVAGKVTINVSGVGTGTVNSVNGQAPDGTGDVTLTKANIGLSNVDNTSDANKPVSTAVQTALNNKVDVVAGKQLSTNDYTTAEKNKLADLNKLFLGVYPTLAALQTAWPTASAGQYAQVDAGTGSNVKNYNWDANDNVWVEGGSGSAAQNTDQLPEGSTNLYFTTARVLNTALAGLSLLTGSAIVAADSILVAMGKLQKQITDLTAVVAGKEPALPSGGTTSQFLRGDKTWQVPPTGGATGGGTNQVFFLNDQAVTQAYTLPTGKNAGSFGPLTISATVTIPSGQIWTITGSGLVAGGSGTVAAGILQLGASGTASNNFYLQTSGSGVLNVYSGNVGSGTLVGTFNASGVYSPIRPALVDMTGKSVQEWAIPTGTRRIVIAVSGLATNGSSTGRGLIQMGTASAYVASGYSNTVNAVRTSGSLLDGAECLARIFCGDQQLFYGEVVLDCLDPTTGEWVAAIGGMMRESAATNYAISGGGTTPGGGISGITRFRLQNQASVNFTSGKVQVTFQ